MLDIRGVKSRVIRHLLAINYEFSLGRPSVISSALTWGIVGFGFGICLTYGRFASLVWTWTTTC
jgi:hypothetical protein